MAEVANTSRSIDSALNWSLGAWNELPEVAGRRKPIVFASWKDWWRRIA